MVTAGAAIFEGAERLKTRIRAIAGELLESEPADLEVAGGEVRVKGVPTRKVTFRPIRATMFLDYLLPTSAEAPEIVQCHSETVSDRNPLGVKGVGEAGPIAPPAAIANAIIDAVAPARIQLNELPLSPAVVAQAIRAAADPSK